MTVYDDYEMTIGIECHVQLATKTKLFSAADNDAREAEPNQKVTAIDFALPGMLPVLNKKAVELAIRAGKALNAQIATTSRFDRKHYFYPDLPKGYQISQMYQPIIGAGWIEVPRESGDSFKVRIHHAHLEEDAGKLVHQGNHSLVDLNRAGTPLIEIVSQPDIHSAADAKAYCMELQKLMIYSGASLGDLYHGNMRFDVNISVAKKGASELGTRSEIKNLNSFRSIEKAAQYEFERQVDLLESGQKVLQQTRGWDDNKQITTAQRSKEDAQDYRYMPDPDIPPVILDQTEIARIQAEVGPLPSFYRQKWAALKLDNSVVEALLANQAFAILVDKIQDESSNENARRVAHWLASAVDSQADNQPTSKTLTPNKFIELAKMVESAELSSSAAKEIFNDLLSGAVDPRQIAEAKNLLQVSDEGELQQIVTEVLQDPTSASSIADIQAGKQKAIGYLVGQVMKKSQGKANPALAQKIIKQKLAQD